MMMALSSIKATKNRTLAIQLKIEKVWTMMIQSNRPAITTTMTANQHVSVDVLMDNHTATDSSSDGRLLQAPNHRPLQRVKLIVSYNGTRFKGFQRQSSGTKSTPTSSSTSFQRDSTSGPAPRPSSSSSSPSSNTQPPTNPRHHKRRRFDPSSGKPLTVDLTIQECIEDALVSYCCGLDRQQMKLRFAGRTDAGVHARGQVVVVNLPSFIIITTAISGSSSAANNNNNVTTITTTSCDESSLFGTANDGKFVTNDDGGGHNDTSSEGENYDNDNLWQIRRAINSRLPIDISIEDVAVLSEDYAETFDPRKDAIRKQYSYTLRYRRMGWLHDNDDNNSRTAMTNAIMNSNVTIPSSNNNSTTSTEQTLQLLPICIKGGPHLLRTGLDPDTCWVCPWALDDTAIDEYCTMLTGTHDYSAFVHKDARTGRDNHMTVERFVCERIGVTVRDGMNMAPICDVKFIIEAKGFGRAQVRNMIGFLVDLCRGAFFDDGRTKRNIVERMLDCPSAPPTHIHAAPACGLCLEKVFYERWDRPVLK